MATWEAGVNHRLVFCRAEILYQGHRHVGLEGLKTHRSNLAGPAWGFLCRPGVFQTTVKCRSHVWGNRWVSYTSQKINEGLSTQAGSRTRLLGDRRSRNFLYSCKSSQIKTSALYPSEGGQASYRTKWIRKMPKGASRHGNTHPGIAARIDH